MIDGSYNITLKSPMGFRNGSMDISSQGNQLTGFLEILNIRNPLAGELVNENEFHIRGVITTPIKQVKYDLRGKVVEDEINAWMETLSVIMEFKGKRLERNDENGKQRNNK